MIMQSPMTVAALAPCGSLKRAPRRDVRVPAAERSRAVAPRHVTHTALWLPRANAVALTSLWRQRAGSPRRCRDQSRPHRRSRTQRGPRTGAPLSRPSLPRSRVGFERGHTLSTGELKHSTVLLRKKVHDICHIHSARVGLYYRARQHSPHARAAQHNLCAHARECSSVHSLIERSMLAHACAAHAPTAVIPPSTSRCVPVICAGEWGEHVSRCVRVRRAAARPQSRRVSRLRETSPPPRPPTHRQCAPPDT